MATPTKLIDNNIKPIVTKSILPIVRNQFKNSIEDFYATPQGISVFVSTPVEDRVRLYYPSGRVDYLTLKSFLELGWKKERDDKFQEIHIRMNSDTVVVVYNYHQANIIYESLIKDYLDQMPKPVSGVFSMDFEMYVSGWGVVQNDLVQINTKGESTRIKKPMLLIGESKVVVN